MSDLQCAATFVLAVAGDEAQARELAADLRFRRIAMVYGGDAAGPERTAGAVADVLGVQMRREALLDGPAVLDGLADQHRGETALVVAEAAVLAALLPSLVPGLPASYGAALTAGDVVQMRVDADGWMVDSWAPEHGSAGGA